MHNTKVINIQVEVKGNSAHNTNVTNIQLEVKENSAHNTSVIRSTRSQRKKCAQH